MGSCDLFNKCMERQTRPMDKFCLFGNLSDPDGDSFQFSEIYEGVSHTWAYELVPA